jgi:Zn finger protein HypA/HybF involved in hydrogenase expression
MGALYKFVCGSCGYQVEVSGGRDAGMVALTATIACLNCQELYDVVTSEHPLASAKVNEIPIRCPKSHSHRVSLWKHPGRCPKCGAILTRANETVLWD